MEKKIKEWDYIGKRYRWTRKAKHQGYIECTCAGCKRVVKHLVKSGELAEIPPTAKAVGFLSVS